MSSGKIQKTAVGLVLNLVSQKLDVPYTQQ